MSEEPGPVCPECGMEVTPELLACPRCRRLLHAEELKSLAGEAEAAEREGRRTDALSAWRRALALLPEDTRQHEVVRARVVSLSDQVDRGPSPPPKGAGAKGAAGLTGLALLLWKLKSLLLLLLTKGKLLLMGLTKASTFLSMFLSFSLYWAAWGWRFALGFVLSIYVHEMGHVLTLRKYGIPATAPMFIPGFGALVRLKQNPATPREDSRTGLAGPLYGLGAAAAALAVFLATGSALWGAVARTGAWINLFNLLPVWQLDGSRGIHSLSRWQRWVVAGLFGAAYFATGEGLLMLLLLASLWRAFESGAPEESDPHGLLEFAFLVVALSAFHFLPVATS